MKSLPLNLVRTNFYRDYCLNIQKNLLPLYMSRTSDPDEGKGDTFMRK